MTQLKSFIPVSAESHFPIQNLPFGVYSKNSSDKHICTALGDYAVDLKVLEENGIFKNTSLNNRNLFGAETLNDFMSLGKQAWKVTRQALTDILNDTNPFIRDKPELLSKAFIPMNEVQMHLPVKIGDYTDFYSSKEHATNVGIMFRGKENALMPNWLHLPVAYHGRASSIVVSGTNIIRPKGQVKSDDKPAPEFSPSKQLDFELETGILIGVGNNLGDSIAVSQADDHVFGMLLVNDWSARDIQKWEYVPLGPFLGKNFATSVSPWIVTMEALEPFRTKGPIQNPEPLEYLRTPNETYDINLEIYLNTTPISRTNFKYLYWNIRQQVAHHTVNGCNLQTGDLLASGTISGSDASSYGSMLELAWKGEKPLSLTDGSERKFLNDGDEVTITGYCQNDDYRVGFGEVKGTILPSV